MPASRCRPSGELA